MSVVGVLVVAGCVLLANEAPLDSGGKLIAEQAAYDVHYYSIDLRVFPDERRIAGSVDIHFSMIEEADTIALDLDDRLDVTSVSLLVGQDGLAADFVRRPGRIFVALPTGTVDATVRVHYSGKPRVAPNPPWVGGFTWERTSSGDHWIATSNQLDGPDLWWPSKDHPSDEADSVRIRVSVPEPLFVATNGRLLDVAEGDGFKTFTWFVSTPINSYNVALNIAPYEAIAGDYVSVAGDTVDVSFWVLPENIDKGRAFFAEIVEHLAWYEDLLGPYPFRADKYGVVETPHLGMEHQTIIAYGNRYTGGPHGYDWLHHHELGHEWWGNLVTVRDWKDFWLHEGLCAYMQPLYTEKLHGWEAYLDHMRSSRGRINNLKPLAPLEPQTLRDMYYIAPDYVRSDGDVYTKGAWILHTLRYLVGDDQFFTSLRRFAYPLEETETVTTGEQCRSVDSDDFRNTVEAVTGRDLEWFFRAYLRDAELPVLVVKQQDDDVVMEWETSFDEAFRMPVEVESGGERRRVEMEEGRSRLVGYRVADIEVDPDDRILKDTG